MNTFIQPAIEAIDRVRSQVAQLGLRYVDLDPVAIGAGIGVSWGSTDFVVLSVSAGNAGWVYLTSGVLRDVAHEPMTILRACNARTSDNPFYSFILHEAEVGWDVIVQQTFPIQLLADVPPFFKMTLESLPAAATSLRDELGSVGGRPHQWADDDVTRLLLSSLF